MTIPVLGIDIAKTKFDAVLLVGTRSLHKEFANTVAGFAKLTDWLAKYEAAQVHAGLEATGTYGLALAEFLHQGGHRVSLINPARIQGYSQAQLARTKTDKTDAALIARFCQTQNPEVWTPPPPEVRLLQALLRRREALIEMRVQETNRLPEVTEAPVRTSLTEHITYLEEQIAEVEKHIKDHFDSHSDLKTKRDLLTSIPGLGDQTAALLLAEMRPVHEYDSARQLAAHAGLTPRQHQSGSSVKARPRLSKLGNARLRKALYLPALVALRFNPILKDLSQRLNAKGKSKMTIVGAAMRKLLHLAFGVLKTGKPFDPNYAKI